MPIIDITLVEGHSEEKKHKLMVKFTEATIEILGAPPESVRTIIREVPGSHLAVAGVPKSKGG